MRMKQIRCSAVVMGVLLCVAIYVYRPACAQTIPSDERPAASDGVKDRTLRDWTPLQLAIMAGRVDQVRELLDKRANVDAPGKLGITALHLAAFLDNPEMVRMLLERGARSKGTTNNIQYHDKVIKEEYDIVKRTWTTYIRKWTVQTQVPLIETPSGAKRFELPSFKHYVSLVPKRFEYVLTRPYYRPGITPLHLAVQNGDAEIVRMLLKATRSVNTEDAEGVCPIHVAAWTGNLAIGRMLVEAGAEPDAKTHSAVTDEVSTEPVDAETIAFRTDHPKFETLLRAPSALHEAVVDENTAEVARLISNGVRADARDKQNATPLHYAARFSNVDAARLLLDHGTDANARDRDGNTPLHGITGLRAAEITKLLLVHGADVNARNRYDSTPIHYVKGPCAVEVATLLLDRGAVVDARNEFGWTPLMLVTDLAVVRLLLGHGASVRAVDGDGRTALHHAALYANANVVKTLLDAGAQADAMDKKYQTPLNVAITRGAKEIVDLLSRQRTSP
jgi:ankyrin repeat protein